MFTINTIAHEIETLIASAIDYENRSKQYRTFGDIEKANQCKEIANEAKRSAEALTAFLARQH